MENVEILDCLIDVRSEISRLNEAAGKTVFNPAATQAVDSVMRYLINRVQADCKLRQDLVSDLLASENVEVRE